MRPPTFRSTAVASGASLWFFVGYWVSGAFDPLVFALFAASAFLLAWALAGPLERALRAVSHAAYVALLGALFVTVFSLYGIYMRVLRIDALAPSRTETAAGTHWLRYAGGEGGPYRQY